MRYHALLQGIFPAQEWNPGLLHGRQILSHHKSPLNMEPKSKREGRRFGGLSLCLLLTPGTPEPWQRLALPCSLKSATRFVGGKPEVLSPHEAQAVLLLRFIGPLIHLGPWLPRCRMLLGTCNQGHLWRVKVREVGH